MNKPHLSLSAMELSQDIHALDIFFPLNKNTRYIITYATNRVYSGFDTLSINTSYRMLFLTTPTVVLIALVPAPNGFSPNTYKYIALQS